MRRVNYALEKIRGVMIPNSYDRPLKRKFCYYLEYGSKFVSSIKKEVNLKLHA
jgi:hypothetical protein